MTDTPDEPPTHQTVVAAVAHVQELDREIEVAQIKAKRSVWAAVAVVGQLVVVFVVALLYLVAHADDTDTARTVCNDRFVNQQRSANLEAFASLVGIVNLVIPEEPPLAPEVLSAQINTLKAEGATALANYRDLVARSTAWGEAGRPLPCPLEP